MCFWTVRLLTRIPSLSSSPRIRSAPQSAFSVAIFLMSAMRSALAGFAALCARRRVFQRQNNLKPCRCQRSKVSGLVTSRASRQCLAIDASVTSSAPSRMVTDHHFLGLRVAMISCWRSIAFSAINSVFVLVASAMTMSAGLLMGRARSRTLRFTVVRRDSVARSIDFSTHVACAIHPPHASRLSLRGAIFTFSNHSNVDEER